MNNPRQFLTQRRSQTAQLELVSCPNILCIVSDKGSGSSFFVPNFRPQRHFDQLHPRIRPAAHAHIARPASDGSRDRLSRRTLGGSRPIKRHNTNHCKTTGAFDLA